MADKTFRAMVVEEPEKNRFTRKIAQKSIADLPEGDVLVRVAYSSLNYKDALSATGSRGVTRNYPHTPGIDAAGIVEESSASGFKRGEKVIVTSYDLGMNTPGGFGEYIRVPSAWVVKLPRNLSLKEAMIYGTAGFTAGLSVYKLTRELPPDRGDILVTGASGGVGGTAVSILVQSGYRVAGVIKHEEDKAYVEDLGASEILHADEVADPSGKPLLKERWAGVVDTVGGDLLATAVKSTMIGGNVTCCGNVASADLPLTVYPFILRGISLFGIDSQHCPMSTRLFIWDRLAGAWKLNRLGEMAREIGLNDLEVHIRQMLEGRGFGRKVVNLAR